MLKLHTILGARPQFIKAAAVSRVITSYYPGDIREKLYIPDSTLMTTCQKCFSKI